MNLRLQKLLKLHRLMAPEGEGGSGGGGSSSTPPEGEATGAADKNEDDKGAGTKPVVTTVSDDTARLLRDVMKQKEKATQLANELAQATERLNAFDGLDPAAIRALLVEKTEKERKEAEARGEYDRLTRQMGERHTEEQNRLKGQITEVQGRESALQTQIANLTVGQAFSGSKFVSEDLTLTATKARVIYGSHFEFKDGAVVAYDKPAGSADRTMLVSSGGSPLSFDEALRKLVDVDPDKEHLIRNKTRPGSGSSTQTRGAKTAPVETEKLTPAQRIAAGLRAMAVANK